PLKFFWDSELDAFISERLNSDHFTHAARKWSSFHAENLAVYERKNKKIKDISADFKTRDERFSSKKVYEMDAFWERVILGERLAEMDNEFTKLLLRLKELDISVIQAVANSDSTFQAKMIEALGFASEQDVINRVNPLLEAEVHLLKEGKLKFVNKLRNVLGIGSETDINQALLKIYEGKVKELDEVSAKFFVAQQFKKDFKISSAMQQLSRINMYKYEGKRASLLNDRKTFVQNVLVDLQSAKFSLYNCTLAVHRIYDSMARTLKMVDLMG